MAPITHLIGVALNQIVSVRHGIREALPPRLKLDASVKPFWFSIIRRSTSTSHGVDETIHLLAFDVQTAQTWSTLIPASDESHFPDFSPNLPPRDRTASSDSDEISPYDSEPRALDGEISSSRCDTARVFNDDSSASEDEGLDVVLEPSADLYYWTDWPFMIRLNGDRWTDAFLSKLGDQIGKIVGLEQEMKPLEAQERKLWQKYADDARDTLDHDELLHLCEARASDKLPDGDKNLLAMQQLQRLRNHKTSALDPFIRVSDRPGNSHAPTKSMENTLDGNRFWAIVVGIDHYLHAPDLLGCVNDVRLLVEYLTSSLRVPSSNILVLASSRYEIDAELRSKVKSIAEPKRANILDALYSHFRDNVRVRPGDNLLFHFSGHGAAYPRGSSLTQTEALCPMDRNTASSPPIVDICDRELNIILSEIRDSKGSNLTVVLDCCHASGADRAVASDVRAAQPLVDPGAVNRMFRSAADDVRRRRRDLSPFSPAWKGDMTSHVLLAACQSHEKAKETTVPLGKYPRLGVFTFALVSALRSPRGVEPSLTYVDLIKSVLQRPATQTFVVAGKRKRSRLWFQEGDLPGSSTPAVET
ncbi:hypothetical protein PENSPDRAFT_689301 [Peniophora sp. CONT]|nr:hypothetical protein PENSPDRAFT_689301 [Peniophora sp. CONT]